MIFHSTSLHKKPGILLIVIRYFLIFMLFFITASSIQYLQFPPGLITADYQDGSFDTGAFAESTGMMQSTALPDISAEAFYVFDCDSGAVLWEKNARHRLYPASTTKIMTAIIVIERVSDLNELVRISPNAAGRNSSFFTFNEGDEIVLLDLLKSALICSHNNATIALAEYISGSEEEFVKLMNQKAIEMGAFNTNFQNTNGLDSNYPEHKTTAEDLAIIAKYCLENELFREIISKKKDYIRINGQWQPIYTTNILLFFDYIKGIKTGFTNNAGYCQVLYSERQGLKLITVVLNSEQGKREEDLLKLINWANDNYKYSKIIDSKQVYKTIELSNTVGTDGFIHQNRLFIDSYPEKDFEKLVNIEEPLEMEDDLMLKADKIYVANLPVELPLKTGQELGNMSVLAGGTPQIEMKLVSRDETSTPFIYQEINIEKNNNFKNLLIFLIAFYFLVFIFIIIKNLILKKRGDRYE